MIITQRVADWASQECHWQGSGELSVARLIKAWDRASIHYVITEKMVLELGALIEPSLNRSGYRKVDVMVGDTIPPQWQNIPRLMEQLVEISSDLSPEQLFKEFEEIHPFRDGNGRVGNILWNMRNGTLGGDRIGFPPNVFEDPQREQNLPVLKWDTERQSTIPSDPDDLISDGDK